jgi:hypothetical protein
MADFNSINPNYPEIMVQQRIIIYMGYVWEMDFTIELHADTS